MTCDETSLRIQALIDGELDAEHAREVEVHAAGCTRCTAALTAHQDLRKALQGHALRFTAPARLRASIDRAVPASSTAASRRSLLKGFALGAAMSAVAATGLMFVVMRQNSDSRIVGEAVSAHLRSLQAEQHLTDVLSTDEHTVKPWFNGRIDLAPPVIDLAGQGFTLIGGRLDYIDGKPAAAIVYRRRKHVINLFVLPGAGPAQPASKPETMQGFHVVRWSEQGLNLLAVSDLAQDELEEFATKFEAAARAAKTG
ncbi:MAG TPA: anti-sigma factor [Xanthobacteraceae bacterium]|jgi:anti-sigma factor RsiW|nr:anti-sigma factor [Xanthobacteraceae bacterium]